MTSMVITTVVIFAPDWSAVSGGVWIQLAATVVFSGVAALIPATVTRIAVDAGAGRRIRLCGDGADDPGVYNAANFIGPVVLTSIAAASGGWHLSWSVTVGASLIGAGLGAFFLNSRRLSMSFTG